MALDAGGHSSLDFWIATQTACVVDTLGSSSFDTNIGWLAGTAVTRIDQHSRRTTNERHSPPSRVTLSQNDLVTNCSRRQRSFGGWATAVR